MPNASQLPDICDCDVKDKDKLALYRNKREEWKRWLSGDDVHSVESQISEMLWDDSLYRTVIQAINYIHNNEDSSIGYNESFINMFVRNFFESQALKIRRFTDPLKEKPSLAVTSLRALVTDIEMNISLVTRENFVCFDGYKYDISQLIKQHEAKLIASNGSLFLPMKIIAPKARHKTFDGLSEVEEAKRSRDDVIDKNKISAVSFTECGEIRTYVNKFVAHASDPKSRKHLDLKEIRPTLDRFDDCYKEIAKAASLIAEVVGEGIAFDVPAPQFELLEDFTKPIANDLVIKIMEEFWEARRIEVRGMRNA